MSNMTNNMSANFPLDILFLTNNTKGTVRASLIPK